MNRVPRYAQRGISPHRHTQPHLSSFSVRLHRCPQNHYPNAPPPGHTCHGVTPGPCMSQLHRLLPNTAPTSKCLSCVSLLMTGFPVTPTEPGPAPSPTSGFRPSGLPTPVSTGVPTGASNLGVCVSSCFTPSLCYCRFPFHLQTLSLNLCYCLSAFSFQFSATALLPLPLLLTHPRVSLVYLLPNSTDPPRHQFGSSGEDG